MNKDLHFSSASPEWYTPRDLVAKLPPFALDVCATPGSTVAPKFYTFENDGLQQNWVRDVEGGRFWMNPPYGRGIGKWVRKADEAARAGAIGYCLLPARTDTTWFQDHVLPWMAPEANGEVHFIRGRLRFWGPNGSANAAPFPSVLVSMGEKFSFQGEK